MILTMKQNSVRLRFLGKLKDFLSDDHKRVWFPYVVNGSPSVKDTIEAVGVPHTEIGYIVANGHCVDFGYQLQDDDKILLYPVDKKPSVKSIVSVSPKFSTQPRFVLDVHLGKLARHLRLLGFDTLYQKDYADKEIVETAAKNKRVVLTRDIGLLKHKKIQYGYWVRATNPKKQIREIVRRFSLAFKCRPFHRCLECNGKIKRIAKKKILKRLPMRTRDYYQWFYICRDCHKIYWRGSHYEELNDFILGLRRGTDSK